MKKHRIIKLCFVLLAGISYCCHTNAQTPYTGPDEPVLESVSIDPQTGHVTINWSQPSPAASPITIDGYIIFWLQPNSTNNYVIDTLRNTALRTYTFDPGLVSTTPPMPDPRKTTVPFTIAAYHKTPYSSSLRTDEDYNIQVESSYDSCRAEIKLNWHPYKGWYPGRPPFKPLINYKVIRIPASGIPELVKTLADQDTAYTVPRVNENEQYTFYIEAERSDGVKATSYQTDKITQMPTPPAFIKAENTQYDAQGLAQVTFTLDPSSQTHSYEFLGSSKPDYSFVSLGMFDNVTGSSLTLTDIQIRQKTYYYKLEAWHVCKNKYTISSNVATALWLYLRQDDQINSLQWDAYMDWGVDVTYQINRRIGTKDTIIAKLTSGMEMNYQDDLSGVKIDGDICYWITAAPTSPLSPDEHAVSNSICIKPESDIWVPEAFTPNGDGNNDEYRPYFSYDPTEYLFIAYDRNGAKVFQTEDLGGAWNGRLKNGKPANEGVYGYYIKFRTAKGKLVEKRGTFSLVIP